MEAARPGGQRRRARRGTVDSPLNTRLVRVAFLLVAPGLLAVLFSVSTTGALPRPPLDPVFDGGAAAAVAADLSTVYPSRVPGSPEAEEATMWFRETVSALGLRTEVDVWTEDLPDLGAVELRNVVTVVPGRSREAIVVLAHRDNAGADQPLGDNASGTAALIELARSFAPQEVAPAPLPQRTLVLVSTDAGAHGGAGAVRFASESPYADGAIAAIVLDGVGGGGRPRIATAGDRPRSPAQGLVGTASARVAEQTGRAPLLPPVLTQLVDLGIPFAAGEQGPLLDAGIAAVSLTTDDPGDPHVPAGDPAAPLVQERLGQLGRATEGLIGSLDASLGGPFRTPDSLFLDQRAASGWTVRLTLVIAVVPFALGVLDLLVRTRRRHLPLAAAVRGLRTRLVVVLYAGLLLWVAALVGALPTGAALALPPYSEAVADRPVTTAAALAAAFVLGWLVARRRLVATVHPTAEERLAGYTVAFVWLTAVAIVIAVAKPYALVFVLPSLYAWLWLPVHGDRRARAALYLLGLSGPVAGLLVLWHELGLGPVDGAFYVASLVTVGYIPLGSALLALAWAAGAAQLGALAFGRYAPYAGGLEPPPPGPVRALVSRVSGVRYARAR
jgi:hypothetical protein